MPRAISTSRANQPPPPSGRILPAHELHRLSIQLGQSPILEPIPSKRVRWAIKEKGRGSPEHLEALRLANLALRAYLLNDLVNLGDPLDWPSPQERGLLRTEFEIAIGGARGGAKSATGMGFLIKGNPHAANPTLVDHSYIYHPHYFGMVLRRNEKDLNDWVRVARRFYTPLGARWIGRPEAKFVFPHPQDPKLNGAEIRTGHLDDADSYRKYIGQNIHRLVIEELIQIPQEQIFMELRASVRTQFPEIVPQILTTFNPIGGPGVSWVFDRYVEPKKRRKDGTAEPLCNAQGEPIRVYKENWVPVYPEPVVEEEIPAEVFERMDIPVPPREKRLRSRVFIPALVTDNPHIDPDYILTIASDPDEQRVAGYLYGEWNLAAGAYLSKFRPSGPLRGEPKNACHVVFLPQQADSSESANPRTFSLSGPSDALRGSYPAPPILPWWHRHMGGDWGYEHEAAFYWGASDPATKRFYVYREMVFVQDYPEHVGSQIARASLDDLNHLESHHMKLWIGRDVSQNRAGSERTVIELMVRGMRQVLGPNSVHVPELLIRELEDRAYSQNQSPDQTLLDTIRTQRLAGITIRWARMTSKAGWEICRSLLRWTPSLPIGYQDFDPNAAVKILFDEGPERYRQYMSHVARRELEVLPVLQIVYDLCPRLIEALPKLQRADPARGKDPDDVDRAHFLGRDCCDAFYYLVQGWREDSNQVEPMGSYIERRVAEFNREWENRARQAEARGEVLVLPGFDDRERWRRRLQKEYESGHMPGAFTPISSGRALRVASRAREQNWRLPSAPEPLDKLR